MVRFLMILVGTVLSLLMIIAGFSLVANIRFNQQFEKEVSTLFTGSNDIEKSVSPITDQDVKGLPLVVQNWLRSAQVIGRKPIQTVHLKQVANLRLDPQGGWLSGKAEQYFTVTNPGFIWKADIKMNPYIRIVGRDKYIQGEGHMLIKILSLIPVVNEKGEKINQGTMLRYLAEIAWFPTAALSDYLEWEEVDDHSAKATMSYGGNTVSGIFTFGLNGQVQSFMAKRYRENKGEYSLDDWLVEMDGHREFNGLIIPSRGNLTWQLDTGDFTWFKCEITDLEYN